MDVISLLGDTPSGSDKVLAVSKEAGEHIFDKDQIGHFMYVVRSGEVHILVNDELMEAVGAGGIIGEMALVDLPMRSATVVAATDCMLSPVNKKRFIELVVQNPEFSLFVMGELSRRLRLMNERTGG